MTGKPVWLDEAPVRRLLRALNAAGIEARFVGGCVRDWLLGVPLGDIDIATPAHPDAVIAALRKARIKGIPTGIAHGTVTAVVSGRPFEITTLRRDVETFGRHARVAFDADWREDAARRDFTINAMYLAPDATLFDYFNGQRDLAAHRIRFVGDPATRIAEDVLRILRYYRFEARFGAGEGDAAARSACRAAVGKLPTLSAERIWRELSRLLGSPEPIRALRLMREDGVLAALLPKATRLDRLERLLALDTLTADPVLRLAAMVDIDKATANGLAARLRLSNADRDRIEGLAKPWLLDPDADPKAQRRTVYRLGRERFGDLAALLAAEGELSSEKFEEILRRIRAWPIPRFPLGGDDVTALGIAPGPRVGQLLDAVKTWWENGDFAATRAKCLAKLKELAALP